MGAEVAAIIAAIASAAGLVASQVRKRKDVDVEEMEKRIRDLTARVAAQDEKIARLRHDIVEAEHRIFVLTRTLAAHGIPDPETEQQ